jgi:hypothetical protein
MMMPDNRQLLIYMLIMLCLFASHCSFSQQLSAEARISLINYGAGDDDISSAFGHTEIRVVDPVLGIDQNYSYGGFNHSADGFVIKFLKGTLPYYIAVHQLDQVAYYYLQTNRSIREQTLNLSYYQRNQLISNLKKNHLPENRYYRYQFFYDNCATRPRDMITAVCGDSLIIPSRSRRTGKSYRDWMNEYLTEKPWYQLGMNLALGSPSDLPTDGWQAMYLPDQLAAQLQQATIRQTNGKVIPLVQNEQTLFAPHKEVEQPLSFADRPDVVCALFGILIILFSIVRFLSGRNVDRWLDHILFGASGFMGWFLLILWLIRDDGVTAWNPSLLYLMPLHIPLVFMATSRDAGIFRVLYFAVAALVIAGGMILSNIPGWFDVIFPVILLVRCVVNCSLYSGSGNQGERTYSH